MRFAARASRAARFLLGGLLLLAAGIDGPYEEAIVAAAGLIALGLGLWSLAGTLNGPPGQS